MTYVLDRIIGKGLVKLAVISSLAFSSGCAVDYNLDTNEEVCCQCLLDHHCTPVSENKCLNLLYDDSCYYEGDCDPYLEIDLECASSSGCYFKCGDLARRFGY